MSKNKFQTRSEKSFERKENFREEKVKTQDKNKIVFSFKDFDHTQPQHNPQNFTSWENDKTLAKLMESLKELTKKTFQEAEREGIITRYNTFPENSDFTCPKYIDEDACWAVIKKISGQKSRAVGYIVDNIFYLVFLDKDHKFWKTSKKNT